MSWKMILTAALLLAGLWQAKADISVGILDIPGCTTGSEGLYQTLQDQPGLKVDKIGALSPEILRRHQVLLISHDYPSEQKTMLREAVADGLGVLLTHDAAGSGRVIYAASAQGSFPEIASPAPGSVSSTVSSRKLGIVKDHPVTRGLPAEFLQQYTDHAVLYPVSDDAALVDDVTDYHEFKAHAFLGTQSRWAKFYGGNCVLAAGGFGTGRVVLYGALPGLGDDDKPAPATGAEKQLLLNAIHWLAGEGETAVDLTPGRTSRYRPHAAVVKPDFQVQAVHLLSPPGSAVADGPLQIRIPADGSAVEVTTPVLRLIAGVEDGVPSLSFLEIFDPAWHHTWAGLERATWSAPVLRLSPRLWPMAALPFKIDHEKGYPQPDFAAAPAQYFADTAELAVGPTGRLVVHSDGTLELTGFARDGRLATWTFDAYETADGRRAAETVAFDLPELPDVTALVKDGSYRVEGRFVIRPRLGITGMSPGVMREITLAGDTLRVIPTSSATRRLTIKKLWKERGTDQFFPLLPQPLELEQATAVADIATWQLDADGFALFTAPGAPGAAQLSDAAVAASTRQLDPDNEDEQVWRRFLIGATDDLPLGVSRGVLSGRDASGRELVRIPLEIHGYVSISTGIFLYSESWRQQPALTPADQWPKLWRDLGMSGLDYLIYGVWGSPEMDAWREAALNRMARYGSRWVASLSEYQVGRLVEAQQGRSLRDSAAPQQPELAEQLLKPVLEQYRRHPLLTGWYLTDEVPQGEPDPASGELPLGYRLANLLYDTAERYVPEDLKINLITTWFTSRASWRDHLKSDVFNYDPYYAAVAGLERDVSNTVAEINTPKRKPLWITLRSCGPTWYDTLDLWFDIRRQTMAAYAAGADSINYFMYAHWMKDMEENAWYMVFPGPQGPVAAPRRQILDYLTEDLALLSTVEYGLQLDSEQHRSWRDDYEQACRWAVSGHYDAMRQVLHRLLAEMQFNR